MFTFLFSDAIGQAFGNSDMQWLLSSIENVVLFIFLTSALFVIIATPLYLLYASVDYYYKSQQRKAHIELGLDCDGKKSHPSHTHKVCQQYLTAHRGFLSNALGLTSWMLFSMIYIVVGYGNITAGIESYFRFPFDVVEIYAYNDALNTLISLESNWLYMLAIYTLTFGAYQIGRYYAPTLAKASLQVNWKKLSYDLK